MLGPSLGWQLWSRQGSRAPSPSQGLELQQAPIGHCAMAILSPLCHRQQAAHTLPLGLLDHDLVYFWPEML